ncbi:GGDEF domain-containing protein [Alteromonas sp. a30]|uniref:GGDEF domain-containing protein n=1 Tax=Alteromonas sp. a30 TaxID=2730917 RepID=UPI0022815A56|nr:diguanylate cyclase [Alteromonas sp. a30]MCY7296312.1 diguanylate cyclase [Alteromonas sp. a30]
MNFNLLRLHSKLIVFNLVLLSLALFMTWFTGEAKLTQHIDWLDVTGEGGTALMVFIWIFFVLISRPAGRVTNLLVVGLGFLHTSLQLDLLDEFFNQKPQYEWLRAYESIPAPIGMIILTLGLYHWHREQLSMNAQLLRRERVYREHGLIDYITGLYSAEYMAQQIQTELDAVQQQSKTHFSVLMLDIDQFDTFVRHYGDAQGDRFLRELSELMLMNIRETDLACRYAGDRFIIILPETTLPEAEHISQQLQQSVAHLAFKPARSHEAVYQHISVSACSSESCSSVAALLSTLNLQMESIKQKNGKA